jgi:aminopeptidase N
VYGRGALTLHALRTTIGEADFRKLLLAWVAEYGGRSASTEDFIALAEETSRQDLAPLFDAWLYQQAMPTLPADGK